MAWDVQLKETAFATAEAFRRIKDGQAIGRAYVHAQRVLGYLDNWGAQHDTTSTTTLLHMAWEELHTGPWDQVSITWREAYTLATISCTLKMLQDLYEKHGPTQRSEWNTEAKACLRRLDISLLVGGPRMANVVHPFIKILHNSILPSSSIHATPVSGSGQPSSKYGQHIARESCCDLASATLRSTSVCLKPSHRLKLLEAIDAPDMLQFERQYMKQGQPCVMHGVADAWPALKRWQSSEYLLHHLGHRTVPVEVGSNYLAEGWGQTMTTFREFFHAAFAPAPHRRAPPPPTSTCGVLSEDKKCAAFSAAQPESSEQCPVDTSPGLLEPGRKRRRRPSYLHGMHVQGSGTCQADTEAAAPCPSPTACMEVIQAGDGSQGAADGRPLQYLAQHSLFDQVPDLRKDIMVRACVASKTPAYCALGDGEVHTVNAWIGPTGTVTPLHTDSHHNIFVQVVGCKYFQMFAPSESSRMYAHEAVLTTNSSQVDAAAPDRLRFPLFHAARGLQFVVQPGQALYIPPGWWHYVRAEAPSISVSFWWS